MYDEYNPSSSRKKDDNVEISAKPSFKLDMGALASKDNRKTTTNAT